MTLSVEASALRDAIARIDAIHHELVADRDRIERQVLDLLDGRWTGEAAQAFSEGWSQWSEDASDVLVALDVERELMTLTLADIEGTDEAQAADYRALVARLEGA